MRKDHFQPVKNFAWTDWEVLDPHKAVSNSYPQVSCSVNVSVSSRSLHDLSILRQVDQVWFSDLVSRCDCAENTETSV